MLLCVESMLGFRLTSPTRSNSRPNGEKRVLVNLAAERPERQQQAQNAAGDQRTDEVRVVIKYTKQVDFSSLRSYLDRTLKTINEDVLEAISMLPLSRE